VAFPSQFHPQSVDRTQARFLALAAVFVALYALVLTLSPSLREGGGESGLLWGPWLGFVVWLVAFGVAHVQSARLLPDRDPFLLPIAALLSGWGMLTIWRLLPTFGLRQSLWLLVSVAVLVLGFRLPNDLVFLRRYKYLWLTGSLLLTGLTLFLGTNPMGDGPRMWLGCCGIYLQPSEPLKLMLIAYLAAYMADRQPYLWLPKSSPSAASKAVPASSPAPTLPNPHPPPHPRPPPPTQPPDPHTPR
jgi:hypothetical protein